MNRMRWFLITVMAACLAGTLAWGWGRQAWSSRVARTGPPLATGEGRTNAADASPAAGPLPAVVAEETFHHFGIMDPAEECAYVFSIRNEGEAPLVLERGPTSCQCTMSVLPGGAIPPGAEVPVRVASKLDQEEGEFSHSAEIFTNDPARKALTLTIAGTIRAYVGAAPPRIVFANLRRDEAGSARSVIYSQVWDAFTIRDVKPSRAGLTWKIAPADPARLAELNARCGYEVEVTTPADLPGGTFDASLDLSLAPAGTTGEVRQLALPLRGEVPAFATLLGEQFNSLRDVVELGVIRPGERGEARLLLVVRDRRELTIEGIESEPPFLQVAVDPATDEGGTYRILVRVPHDAPPSNFCSEKKAKVRIRTDHPQLPLLTFQVEFAVTG